MATFFEIHYYDGGLKTELVPGGPRPGLLPEPSGPRSTELELPEGDFAVELLCLNRKGRKIVWIGVYTFGIDRQHGARGNYCGVGVWLIDLVPVYVDRILSNLSTFALRVSQDRSPSPDILGRLENAATTFDDFHWCVAAVHWPSALLSAAFNPVDDGSSAYLTGRQNERLDLKLVAADILHQFTRKPKADEARPQRRLYFSRHSSKLPPGAFRELDYPSVLAASEQAISEFCAATAEPMAEQNALLERQRLAAEDHAAALASARNDLVTQTQRGDGLQAALRLSEEQRAAMQETFAAVRKFTADEGGAGDETISTRLDAIQGMLGDINRLAAGWAESAAPRARDSNADTATARRYDDPARPKPRGIFRWIRRARKSPRSKRIAVVLAAIALSVLAGVAMACWNRNVPPTEISGQASTGRSPIAVSRPAPAPAPESTFHRWCAVDQRPMDRERGAGGET